MADSSDEAEIERRIRLRQEQQALKDQVARNTEAVAGMRTEMTDKLERMGHNIVEQISERWEDKTELLESRLEKKIDALILKLDERFVHKTELADEIEKGVDRHLLSKTSQQRNTVQFYVRTTVWIVAILSPILSAIYAVWLSRGGQ